MDKFSTPEIVLIGAGNVAYQLARRFVEKKITILQIYNRNVRKAQTLAQIMDASYTDDLAKITKDANLYIICVSDAAIEEVSFALSTALKDKLVVHTSGAISSDVLQKNFSRYGILYPLQTFTIGSFPDFDKIPIFISANNVDDQEFLFDLASIMSNTVESITDQKRLILHLGAVFANNFSNHLFTLSAQLLKDNQLDFHLLLPLIEETVNKIKEQAPAQVQTGPAKRGDLITIHKHLEAIKENKSLQKIYLDISRSINPDLNI